MIRDLKPIDEDFVYDSWLRSVRCPTRMVTDMTRCLVDYIKSIGNIKIYCADDDEDHIIGWISFGQLEGTKLLHFLFVKKDFRGNGVGTELLKHVYPEREDTVFCTYWSFHMQQIDARRRWNTKFSSNLLPAVIFDILNNQSGQEEYACA
jgi:GNAT superfamily N-acetyltransferase